MNNWETDDGVLQYLLGRGLLDSHSTVIDIGANFGQEIEALAPIGCQVHSFEPHPVLYEKLKNKYKDDPNVTIIEKAAWHTDTKRLFYFKRSMEDRNGGATLIKGKTNIDKNIHTEVECIDIVQYVEDLDTDIDWFKLDAEGAEYKILRALFERGAYKKIKNLYYEDHGGKINDMRWMNYRSEYFADFNDIILNEFECSGDDVRHHHLWIRKNQ